MRFAGSPPSAADGASADDATDDDDDDDLLVESTHVKSRGHTGDKETKRTASLDRMTYYKVRRTAVKQA